MDKCVITGMGLVSTAGHSLESFWESLHSGNITYSTIPEFRDDDNYRIKIGGKIFDDSWKKEIDPAFISENGRASAFTISAAVKALKDANLKIKPKSNKLRVGICIGTTMGEIQEEEFISQNKNTNSDEIIGKSFEKLGTFKIGQSLRRYFAVPGPTYILSAACASGNYAIKIGKQLLNQDLCDIVIAGGVDAFSRVAFTGFQRLLSLTPDYCRPFDKARRGLIVSEGCGIVILEKYKNALDRGAIIKGEVAGVGLASDGYHMTSPHPEGKSTIKAIERAMLEADISIEDIDYISAHGTGTLANDKSEAKALKNIFYGKSIPPTSSIKSMLGHSMGAASALELIASIQMMHKDTILPTKNYQNYDENCDLDCVPNEARKQENINCILSTSFAFGGQVSGLILKRVA